MKGRRLILGFLSFLLLGVGMVPAFAGDSLYGKVTEVRSADVVLLENGGARFIVRIVGIETPKEGPLAAQAKEFVSKLVLGKNARMRLEARTPKGEMIARLLTDDPEKGIKDVGLELVRSGLAQRQRDYDYKYGELSKAQEEARRARRGLWSTEQQK
ncbi:MAG: thermonuclease family protein [Acidobacteriia bacterium]|nr:thermonuclease family protein [Terriglobia bacterium]